MTEKSTHKTHLKAHTAKIILCLILLIGLISCVSAIDFEDNLLAYWDFQAEADISGNDHDLEAVGSPVFTTNDALEGKSGNLSANANRWNVTTAGVFDWNGDDYSIAGWTKIAEFGAFELVMGKKIGGDNDGWNLNMNATGGFNFDVEGGDAATAKSDLITIVGEWHFFAVTKNSSHICLWVNETLNCVAKGEITDNTADLGFGDWSDKLTSSYAGLIDEVSVWSRTLTPTDVADLFNNGEGEFMEGVLAVATTLSTPVNNINISSSSWEFNASMEAISGNFTNATLYIYDTINDTVTVTITGATNTSSHTITDLILGNYTWNIEACAENVSNSVVCEFAATNRSFDLMSLTVINETYSNSTTEGSLETFEISVDIFDNLQITTAYLLYNGTSYLGSITDLGSDIYYITRDLIIPDVAAATSFNFSWNITLDNDFIIETSGHNQTISLLAVDDCSTYKKVVLNLTLRDEETQDSIVAATYNTSVEIDLKFYVKGTTTQILNFSMNYSEINPCAVCIPEGLLNTTEYRMDTTIRYEGDSYAKEFYHIQNFTVTNNSIPQNINLFDLKEVDSTEFLITYKDESFLRVSDALIDITRQYVSDGVFKTVEIPKTDLFGQAVGHLDTDGVVYTIIVKKYGVILATFDNVAVVCADVLAEDCRINLHEVAAGDILDDPNIYMNLAYTMTFDEPTRTVTTQFTVLDGSVATILINTTKSDRFGNDSVCYDSLTSSSGTLTCLIPLSYGNVSVMSELFIDGDFVTREYYSIAPEPGEIFGGTEVILALALVITLPLMLITSLIGTIIGAMLGVIFAILLTLVAGGSMFSITSVVIWLVIAGIIIIWKISERGGG